ncbi:MAG: hypothetical protein A2509_08385 [Candidatus Edwardsbacteria bacterium RIFOXYD12_FULL_50_11]|uniref:DUF4440 domain-containing protein n=1 Tax=Candidatus Edwardsbacteria bacterium GWF2_54_11 TaxID=1817851 RepID=A0A1F5RGU5_9BACT|nr:MAG: hypothetical protein A2502_01750 [Candidatus Edwardsbacteria bacterium RifOxyC12_full_54_24]OGF08992.1 MAG: hypothetical protein A2273_10205 [Candidatus Edwardsbacteria bacterium RifOxyA12_full_54_48]OGF12479.1 MAG: hypothetical protein A3K15_01375 [Candidatus Edwardsbacteria bacterium GWE2_54_12]OGF13626.1 MAG: hypothetical protein A2024_10830 [Candidatus Edwardsbacteria bacterium GWF2_54_11]OGF17416.1 MAG: hypothetical protein A2509_08385 [Candidatus Edwardsbacteria bacterium RIFOXYD1
MLKVGKNRIVLAAIVLAVLIVFAVIYNNWLSPKAKVKAVVEQTTKAFLIKNKALIMENISPDFYCDPFDKPKVDTSLTLFFREFEKAKVTLNDQKVQVTGDEATDTIGVIVVVSRGGEQGFILGSFGNPARLTLKLKKRKKWQITGVEGLKIY